ncbi:hypothetical protein Mycch_2208 [Mycolicibacterium chubuense NBB4]|uniref:DUF2190 domain-containing protein n=1 Tax=Mycolicibacterium chubuense (strain NBB4) TaxID=710421 RepID=I4BI84_MYCCN|nr:capsid cement protein [Mycolicibacterium chubuense]AFM16991.1 hypothetical protein Mycch_2208 [Mycolicibacterium chubuense NBB4]
MSTTLSNSSVYAPGADITAEASAAVTARRFLAISGNRASGGNVSVAPATAAGRVCGVAGNDAASGELVTVVRGNSRVVKVTADGAITAFAEVEVGTAGKAKAKASGIAVGYAINGAADGADAEISLY